MYETISMYIYAEIVWKTYLANGGTTPPYPQVADPHHYCQDKPHQTPEIAAGYKCSAG